MNGYNPYGNEVAQFYPVSWLRFHVLFWLFTSLFSIWYFIFFDTGWINAITTKALYLPTQLVAAYVLILVFLRKFLIRDKYIEFLLFSALWLLGFSMLSYLSYEKWVYSWINVDHNPADIGTILKDINGLLSTYLRVIFLLPLILMCFEIVFYLYAKLKLVNVESHRKRSVESNYQKLRYKSDFIVDTLANLSVMIEGDDAKSLSVIEKLSSTLDFILYQGNDPSVSLMEEVNCVSNYCDLEGIRGDVNCEIDLNIDVQNAGMRIRPLFFLSFVEGILRPLINEMNGKKKIAIHISQTEDTIHCTMTIMGMDRKNEEAFKKMIPILPYKDDATILVKVEKEEVIFHLEIHNLKND